MAGFFYIVNGSPVRSLGFAREIYAMPEPVHNAKLLRSRLSSVPVCPAELAPLQKYVCTPGD